MYPTVISHLFQLIGSGTNHENTPIYCDICDDNVLHFNQHMSLHHPGCGQHNSNHGYRSNGRYHGDWFGGICGTGSPYYLLCLKCHDKYMKKEKAHAITSLPEGFVFCL